MLCQSGKPACYQRNFLHIAFLRKYLQLLKSYIVTGSRCSHCWSVLDKGFAQTCGSRLILPAYNLQVLLFILANFPDLFPLIFILKYCFVQDLCLPPLWQSSIQRQVRKTRNEWRYLCCFMVIPLLITILLHETVVGGLNDISKPRT